MHTYIAMHNWFEHVHFKNINILVTSHHVTGMHAAAITHYHIKELT